MSYYTQNIQARAAAAGQRQFHSLYTSRAPYVAEQFVADEYKPPTANQLGGAPTYGNLYTQSMANLDAGRENLRGLGNAQAQTLALQRDARKGQALQKAPYLSSTTMMSGVRQGFDEAYDRAMNALGERVGMQQYQAVSAQEQQRAQLASLANQQAQYYDAMQQKENAQTSQMNLGLGGIQSRNIASRNQFMLGAAAIAQRGAAMQQGGGGGYSDFLGGGGSYTPPNPLRAGNYQPPIGYT